MTADKRLLPLDDAAKAYFGEGSKITGRTLADLSRKGRLRTYNRSTAIHHNRRSRCDARRSTQREVAICTTILASRTKPRR